MINKSYYLSFYLNPIAWYETIILIIILSIAGSYKSRQAVTGPAPFASFEDLSDYTGAGSSPEELEPLPGMHIFF